jgi:hypothetical protein
MNIQPDTRRLVVLVLGIIALCCIAAELFLSLNQKETSDALMTLASVCAGALAGLVTPHDRLVREDVEDES